MSITFGSSADGETAAEKEEEPVEVSPEQREKAEEKIKFVFACCLILLYCPLN